MALPKCSTNTQSRANVEGLRQSTFLGTTTDSAVSSSESQIVRPRTPSLESRSRRPSGSGSSDESLRLQHDAPPTTPNGKQVALSHTGEPSLYAAIFGPQVAQQLHAAADAAAPKTPPQDNCSSFPKLRSGPSPSPRIRKGSSAKLHQFCSMPQLGSPERARRGGPPVGVDPHNAPTRAHLDQEDAMAFAHPHQSWVLLSPSRRRGLAGSPSSNKRKRVDQSLNVASLSPSTTHAAPSTPTSSHRSRMASAGFLPNGHPATPLAQGLGLNQGGVRSRQSSLAPATPSKVRFSSDIQTSEETDRVAGVLAAMADERLRRQQSSATNTPSKRDFSNWADPSSITPRRAKIMKPSPSQDSDASVSPAVSHAAPPSTPPPRKTDGWTDEGDRTSASLLLHLANSPSVSQSPASQHNVHDSTSRSASNTPKLWNNFERRRMSSYGTRATPILRPALSSRPLYEADEEEEADAEATTGLNRAGAPLPVASSLPTSDSNSREGSSGDDTGVTSGDSQDGSGFSKIRRVSHSVEGDGTSPITPPRTDQFKSVRQMEDTVDHSATIATPPPTPSKAEPLIPLPLGLSHGRAGRSRQFSQNPDGTPRTPSPVPSEASNPRTPHTPNTAAFAYSEFVNVSPSPKPRSRGPSGRFTPSLGQFDDVASWEEAMASHEAQAHSEAGKASPALEVNWRPTTNRRHREPSAGAMLTPGPLQGTFAIRASTSGSPVVAQRQRPVSANGSRASPAEKYYPASPFQGSHHRQPSSGSSRFHASGKGNPGLGFDM